MSRILVIDDEIHFRTAVKASLRATQFEVLEAEDAEGGLQMARTHLPDLVLCDLYLRPGSGWDVLTELRAGRATASIPFILMTGSNLPSAMRQSMNLGADDFLRKPFTAEEMLVAVKARLSKQAVVRAEAGRMLQQSERRFRAIADAALDAIILMGPDGRISFWNPAAERTFGHTAAEAMGQMLHELVVPTQYHAAHGRAFPQFQSTGQGEAIGRTLELTAVRKDGTEFPVELSLSAVSLDGQWHSVGIVRDITERNRTANRLRVLSRAIEQTPASIVITDPAGRIEYVNPCFEKVTGYTAAEAIGQNPRVLRSGTHPPEIYRELWKTITSGKEWSGEFHNRRKSGEDYWEQASISPVRDEGGHITNFLAVKQDITERKRVDRTLRDSQALYLSLVENLPQCVFRKDREGRFQFCNRRFCEVVKHPMEEILGKTDADLFPPGLALAFRQDDLRVMASGETLEQVEENVGEDGRAMFVQVLKTPLRDASGAVVGIQGIFWDITERKHAEDAMRQSEARFRSLFDNMLNGFAYCRMLFDGERPQDYIYLAVNNAFESLTGLKNVVGKRVSEVIPGVCESDPEMIASFGRVARTGVPERIEIYVEALQMWCAIALYCPEPDHFVAVFDVITERKAAEEAVRANEVKFRVLSEEIPQMVWMCRPDGWNIYFNQRWVEYTGMTLEESYGHGWNKPFHPDDRQRAWDAWRLAIETGGTYDLECRLRRADGAYQWFIIRGLPMRDAAGQIVRWFGTCTDFHDRKGAEVALRESEERFRVMFELASIGMAQSDPKTGQWLRVNQKMCAITGYSADEMLRLGFAEMITHPEDWQKQCEAHQRTVRGEGSEYRVEKRYLRKDGSIAWVNVNATLIWDAAGQPFRGMSTIEDITERKRLDERLAQEHNLSEAIINNMPGLFYLFTEKGRFLRWNRRSETASGYSGEEIARMHPLDIIAAQHKELVAKEIWQVFATGFGQVEASLLTKQGEQVPYHFTGATALVDGQPCLVGAGTDITERKRLEEERSRMELHLRHSQKLEAIGQLASGISHEINTPVQFIGDNTRFLGEIFGGLDQLLDKCGQLIEAGRIQCVTPELVAECGSLWEAADVNYLRAEVPSALRQTLEGIERISKIVRAMKDFSHPGTDEKALVDLNRLVESTLTVSRNEWKYVADLVTDFDPALTAVPCLPGEFNQVILNLVVNAAHAITDALGHGTTSKGTLTVTTRRIDGWAEVRLTDTGTGIPESARPHIFEPFFTTKDVGRGTGQGLAIAHSVIADKHGGTIRFETEMGKGTTFILQLPLVAPQNTNGRSQSSSARVPACARNASTGAGAAHPGAAPGNL